MLPIDTSSWTNIFEFVKNTFQTQDIKTVKGNKFLFHIDQTLAADNKEAYIAVEHYSTAKVDDYSINYYKCSCSISATNTPYLEFNFTLTDSSKVKQKNVQTQTKKTRTPSELKHHIIASFTDSHLEHILIFDTKLNRVRADFSDGEYEDGLKGLYRDKKTIKCKTHSQYEEICESQPLDVTEFLPYFMDILFDYGYSYATEEMALATLNHDSVKMQLLFETENSISDTLPREELLATFHELYPAKNHSEQLSQ